MAQRRSYIATDTRWRARHHRRRPSFPLGTKPWGTQQPWGNKIQGQTSGQTDLQGEQQQRPRRTKQRLKRKQQEQRSWKIKVETPKRTMPNLQGYGRYEDVNNNDNRTTSTRIEPVTTLVKKPLRNPLSHPACQLSNKNKI